MRAGTKAVALPQKCPNARGASDNGLQALTRTPREKKGPVGHLRWQRRGPAPQPEAGLAPPHSTASGWLPVPCMWQRSGGGGAGPKPSLVLFLPQAQPGNWRCSEAMAGNPSSRLLANRLAPCARYSIHIRSRGAERTHREGAWCSQTRAGGT